MIDANTWDVEHPGRWSRNGAPQSKLPRSYGPPRDETAWARRLAEICIERTDAARPSLFVEIRLGAT